MSISKSTWSGSQALTTSFAGVQLEVPAFAKGLVSLGGLWLFLTSVSTAVSLTVRITRDAAGDECLVPDTSVNISTGKTTAGDGTCVLDLNRLMAFESDTYYVFAKTNAGTATLVEAKLTQSNR